MSKATKSLLNDDCMETSTPMAPTAPEFMVERMEGQNNGNHNSDLWKQGAEVEDGCQEARMCRICLQTDDADDLIAPCLCSGSSKWVHRACLNEWRIHEQDRAFSACTECHYKYHFIETQDRRLLRMRFCWFFSRDVCLVTFLVQLVIIFLSWIVQLIDRANGEVLLHMFGRGGCLSSEASGDETGWWCRHRELAVYYMYGVLTLLVLLGIFGSGFLCRNNCQIPDLNQGDQDHNAGTTDYQRPPSYNDHFQQEQETTARNWGDSDDRTEFYRQRRIRRRTNYRQGCCEDCCMPRYGYYPYYHYQPYYYAGSNDCCCCYCPTTAHNNQNYGDDCSCCHLLSSCGGGNSSSSNSDNDAAHIMLIILLVVVVIFAVIGLLVGVFLAIVIGQRIIQRHVILLEKSRLVDRFQVKDMSPYDLQAEATSDIYNATPVLPPPTGVYDAVPVPPPVRSLRPEEASHLRKMGLLD